MWRQVLDARKSNEKHATIRTGTFRCTSRPFFLLAGTHYAHIARRNVNRLWIRGLVQKEKFLISPSRRGDRLRSVRSNLKRLMPPITKLIQFKKPLVAIVAFAPLGFAGSSRNNFLCECIPCETTTAAVPFCLSFGRQKVPSGRKEDFSKNKFPQIGGIVVIAFLNIFRHCP